MAKRLVGKVAVVTGSGRGVGRGVAMLLAREGASVVVNDIFRDPDGASAADKVVQEIRQNEGTAVASYDTVNTMAGGENIIRVAIDSFGKVNILVNCAGNFMKRTSVEITESEWDSIVGVHLKGHFACIKAAMPHMIQQKNGRIVNFTSRAAFTRTGGGNLAYSAAKAGVLGLTMKLSGELAPYNITVNAISPSAVTQLFPVELLRRGSNSDNLPTAEQGDPDFVAPMVVYLATDEASSVTGRIIYAAGGDICLYTHPMKLAAANIFIRKPAAKWTVEELIEVLPPLLEVG